MTKPRRRQAGEGGISSYTTKAGIRYWAKYRVPVGDDGTTKEVLKRGFLTRKAAADFLTEKRAESRMVCMLRRPRSLWVSGSISGLKLCVWHHRRWRPIERMSGCT
jgi:hypothetical protein